MNELSTIVESQRNQFMAVASKDINFDREAQFVSQLLDSNEYLSSVAMRNKNSIIAAVNNVAAIGISLNPAQKLAYLVPRKVNKMQAVCLDISYMGVMHIAQTSGAIKWGQAEIVRENDSFELTGIDQPPKHHFNPFNRERGAIIGCYVVVKTDTNDYLTHSMPIDEIFAIRDRSESWKSRQAKINDGEKYIPQSPWASDEGEMIKKTVVKQASKYWPRRERLDNAVHYLHDVSHEGIDFEKDITPKKPYSVTGEALESLDGNEQDRARELAARVKDLIDEGFNWKAHDLVYTDAVDHEFLMAIWAVLGQQKMLVNGNKILYRSVITKHHEAQENGERPETGDE